VPELAVDNQVVFPESVTSWAQLVSRAVKKSQLVNITPQSGPIALVVDDVEAAFEAVALMVSFDLDAIVLSHDQLGNYTSNLLVTSGYTVVEYPSGKRGPGSELPRPACARVGLLTSGSTGKPKLIHHTWTTLFSGERCQATRRRRWLVPYQVGTYAWYQMVTMGLFQPGQDLVPLATPSGADFVQTALEKGVDSVSSTPTLWRLVLLGAKEEDIRALSLKQITLGGEIVDQPLLNRLRALFPDANVTQVYASSEAGVAVVVQDGQAGFPADLLRRDNPRGPTLRIQDGRLWVRSPYSACSANGKPAEWVDTGDCVELRDDRVYFLGRRDSGVINVGGAKLLVSDIEAVVLEHPAVAWCRVRGVRAPLVGNLPKADFVVKPGYPIPTDAELVFHCRAKLPRQAIPRFWSRLESIPIEASLKAAL